MQILARSLFRRKPLIKVALLEHDYSRENYDEIVSALRSNFRVKDAWNDAPGLGGGGGTSEVIDFAVGFVTVAASTLQGIPTELLGAALYDMMQKLKPRRQGAVSRIYVMMTRENGNVSAGAWIESKDTEHIHAVVSQLTKAVSNKEG